MESQRPAHVFLCVHCFHVCSMKEKEAVRSPQARRYLWASQQNDVIGLPETGKHTQSTAHAEISLGWEGFSGSRKKYFKGNNG